MEPDIIVNGVRLTTAQAMSVRVAVGSMLIDLSDKQHMKDLGEAGPLYQKNLVEVSNIMHRK